MSLDKTNVVIFKNDAVGDLTQSLPAIHRIIEIHKDQKIIIYLSERSEKFDFLINGNNLEFKILNYDLNLFEKLKIIINLINSKISNVYILTPKNFYFYLPFLFRKIKFYGLCVNGPKKYRRPNKFLRKFLFKSVINNREAVFKRSHTTKLQLELVDEKDDYFIKAQNYIPKKKINYLLPNDYIYFHYKEDIISRLSWNLDDIKIFFDEILKFHKNIIFTRDIGQKFNKNDIVNHFQYYDFKKNQIFNKDKDHRIILFENIEGVDLYNTIINAKKILAFHGMMTNLGSLNKKEIIDMWFCDINNWDDYRNYRNAFYEFKPIYEGYNFIIPSRNMKKTIKKIRSFLS